MYSEVSPGRIWLQIHVEQTITRRPNSVRLKTELSRFSTSFFYKLSSLQLACPHIILWLSVYSEVSQGRIWLQIHVKQTITTRYNSVRLKTELSRFSTRFFANFPDSYWNFQCIISCLGTICENNKLKHLSIWHIMSVLRSGEAESKCSSR